MKKIYAIILTFLVAINLYCFDLIEDAFDFIFDDLAKVIGIIVIILVIVFFTKRFMNKNKN